MYQVVAYQTAYDVPGVLAYPDNDGAVENDYSVKNGHSLAMLELPTGVSTADVGKFGRGNVGQFFDLLSRIVG